MVLRIIDIETTGTDPASHRIVEIASVDLMPDGSIANLQEHLVNPGHAIPPETSAVHHILDEDVADAPSLDKVIAAYQGATFYVAHNANFEQGFLNVLLGHPKWICTYRTALRLWPEAPGYSNQTLRYWLGEVHPGGHDRTTISPHRALSDCIVTAAILNKLLQAHQGSYEELLQWSGEPALLRTITFGKHRGMAYKDAPVDYLQWLVDKTDMDANVKFSAKHALLAQRS